MIKRNLPVVADWCRQAQAETKAKKSNKRRREASQPIVDFILNPANELGDYERKWLARLIQGEIVRRHHRRHAREIEEQYDEEERQAAQIYNDRYLANAKI